jgi:hypothetical protein
MADVQSDVTLLATLSAVDEASPIVDDVKAAYENLDSAAQTSETDIVAFGEDGGAAMSTLGDTMAVVGESISAVVEAIGAALGAIGIMGAGLDDLYYQAATGAEAYAGQLTTVEFLTGETSQQSAAMIAGFEGVGISTQGAVSMLTRLTANLGALSTAQDTNGKLSKAQQHEMDQLGISFTDAHGGMLPMTELMPVIIDHLKNMTNVTERDTLARKLFGRSFADLAPLIQAGGAAFIQSSKDAAIYGNALSQGQVDALNAFKAAQQTTKEALEGFIGVMAERALPYLMKFEDEVKKLIAWYQALSPHTKTMIQDAMVLVASLGTLAGGGFALSGAFGILERLLPGVGGLMGGLLGPVMGLLGPIGLIVAIVLALNIAYTNNAEAHRILQPMVQVLGSAFQFLHTHMNIVVPVVAALVAIYLAFNAAMLIQRGIMAGSIVLHAALAIAQGEATVTEIAMSVGGWMAAAAELAMLWPLALIVLGIVAVIAIGYLLVTHWTQVHAVIIMLWDKMKTFAEWIVGAFVATWNTLIGVIGGFFNSIVGAALAGWKAFTDHPMYYIGFIIAYIPTKLMELQRDIEVWFATVVLQAGIWAINMVQHAATAAVGFVNAVRLEINALPGQIQAWLNAVMPQVSAWAVNMALGARSSAQGFIASLNAELAVLPAQMIRVGVDIIQGIIQGIKSMMNAGIGAIGDFIHGLIAGAHAAGQGGSPYLLFAHEVGETGIIGGVIQGINNGASAAQSAMGAVIGKLAGGGIGGSTIGEGSSAMAALGEGAVAATMSNAAQSGQMGGGGNAPITVVSNTYLDGKLITRQVSKQMANDFRLKGGLMGSAA